MNPQLSQQLLEASLLNETQFDSILRTLAAIYSASSAAPSVGGPLDLFPQGVESEQIAMRAYHIDLHRGGTHGQDLADWLQAERELGGTASTN